MPPHSLFYSSLNTKMKDFRKNMNEKQKNIEIQSLLNEIEYHKNDENYDTAKSIIEIERLKQEVLDNKALSKLSSFDKTNTKDSDFNIQRRKALNVSNITNKLENKVKKKYYKLLKEAGKIKDKTMRLEALKAADENINNILIKEGLNVTEAEDLREKILTDKENELNNIEENKMKELFKNYNKPYKNLSTEEQEKFKQNLIEIYGENHKFSKYGVYTPLKNLKINSGPNTTIEKIYDEYLNKQTPSEASTVANTVDFEQSQVGSGLFKNKHFKYSKYRKY